MNSRTTARTQPTQSTPAAPYGPQHLGKPHVSFASRGNAKPAPAPTGTAQLAALGVKKTYTKGATKIPVLGGVDLEVFPGELLSIIGSSGSGKSTLMHLLGTLDTPDAGEIHLAGKRIDNLPSKQREMLRNRYFGMVFQFYHLLPELTLLENVLVPAMIAESSWGYFRRRRQHHEAARELIEMVGLSHRLRHKPRELSGGEMQRTAIARALVTEPEVLLADEPTGNLDHRTGREILDILHSLNEQRDLTIVMVTHDVSIASQADRTVQLSHGKLMGE